jgi:hypothetical protein
MKMVAASKMRNAQLAVENSRGIVEPFVRLFGDHPGAAQCITGEGGGALRTRGAACAESSATKAAVCVAPGAYTSAAASPDAHRAHKPTHHTCTRAGTKQAWTRPAR